MRTGVWLAPLPDLREQRQPVQLGQHQIENDHIVPVTLGVPESLLAVGGSVDGIAVLREPLGQSPVGSGR